MSSSTVQEKPWIYMQRQGYASSQKEGLLDKTTRRRTKTDQSRFAQPTASSRQRAGAATSDTTGPEVDHLATHHDTIVSARKTSLPANLHRKSIGESEDPILYKLRPTPITPAIKLGMSPRHRTTSTVSAIDHATMHGSTLHTDDISRSTSRSHGDDRDDTGSIKSRIVPVTSTMQHASASPGGHRPQDTSVSKRLESIKSRPSDALRDEERMQARLDIKPHPSPSARFKSHASLNTDVGPERRSNRTSFPSRGAATGTRSGRLPADIISESKRRLSLNKEKAREVMAAEGSPRRRTVSSSGSALRAPAEKAPNSSYAQHYMKPTIADQRRRSQASSPTPKPRSLRGREKDGQGDEDDVEQQDGEDHPFGRRRSRRISTLSISQVPNSASTSPSAEHSPKNRLSYTDDDGPETPSHGDMTGRRRMGILGKPSDASGLGTSRRLSRPGRDMEPSKPAGNKSTPRLAPTAMARRKSSTGHSDVEGVSKRVTSRETKHTTTRGESAKKAHQASNASTTRKRGQTLPGSLAKPPQLAAAQTLPPLKVGPIRSVGKNNQTVPSPRTRKTSQRSSVPANEQAVSQEDSVDDDDDDDKSVRRRQPNRPAVSQRRRSSIFDQANASPKTRPWSTRRPSAPNTGTEKMHGSIVNTGVEGSPLVGPCRTTGKLGASSAAGVLVRSGIVEARKDSWTSEHEGDKPRDAHRAMSLQERLQAMVAEHARKEKETTYSGNEALHTKDHHRGAHHEVDERFHHLLAADRMRLDRNRLSDSFLWDIESHMPKSPELMLQFCNHHLTPYERNEIRDHPLIYFYGPRAVKNPGTTEAHNWGYDDERGDYQIVVHDHLAYRYEVLKEMGRGSFGQVVKCLDHKTGNEVAIKLIRNRSRYHRQALTEVKILKRLIEWDRDDEHHNLRMTDHFIFRGHLCIACECLSMNLYELISKHDFMGFHVSLIKKFCVQILKSLCLLYDHGVVHCDLKPENILLKHHNKSAIKVIDFGSSCFEHERVYTYIQSRFYRAPEIILSLNYNMAIDMWSLGCILAELYTGIPLFPGEDEHEQIQCIMEILGQPDEYLIEQSSRRKLFFDSKGNARIIPNSKGKSRKSGTKTLSHAMRCHDTVFLDFISRCLDWDPERRMTPYEAFQHEWIQKSSSTKTSAN